MTANGRHKFIRTLAACTAAAALAAPAAQASPALEQGSDPGPATDPIVVEAPPVTPTIDDGFDWGAAALGAGGAGMVLLLSLGGAAQVSRSRARVTGA